MKGLGLQSLVPSDSRGTVAPVEEAIAREGGQGGL